MISVPVVNKTGEQVGTYEFDPAVLADRVNRQLLHDVVVMYESNRRLGTVQTKGRSHVAGSKKKLYRQKGTGRARMGPKRSPIRRGGGHAHRKVPVDWTYRLPRKAVQLATRMALLSKFEAKQVVVLDELAMAAPKTKEVVTLLKALQVGDKSCLLTIAQHDPMVWRSARNIPTVHVLPASDLNAYEVLKPAKLVLTRAALDRLTKKSEPAAQAAS